MEPKLPHNLLFMTLKEILKTEKNVKICPQNLIAFFRTHGKDIVSYTLLSYTGNSKCKLSNFASIFIDFTEWRTFLKELLKNWTSNFIFIFQTKRNYLVIWLFSLSLFYRSTTPKTSSNSKASSPEIGCENSIVDSGRRSQSLEILSDDLRSLTLSTTSTPSRYENKIFKYILIYT